MISFDDLYKSYYNYVKKLSLYGYSRGLRRQAVDVEDVCQETFLQLYKQLPKIEGDTVSATFIKRVTHGIMYHVCKKGRTQKRKKDKGYIKSLRVHEYPLDSLIQEEALQSVSPKAKKVHAALISAYSQKGVYNNNLQNLNVLLECRKLKIKPASLRTYISILRRNVYDF